MAPRHRSAADQPSFDDFFVWGPTPVEDTPVDAAPPQAGLWEDVWPALVTGATTTSGTVPVDGEAGDPVASPAPDTGTGLDEGGRVDRFRPVGTDPWWPRAAVSRVRANLAAIRVVKACEVEGRPATVDEYPVLAAYSGWGGDDVWKLFDDTRYEYGGARDELRGLLTAEEWEGARASTVNANFTEPALVAAIWDVVTRAGFRSGRVLEPGCGTGVFVGLAPVGATMVGVEIDPVSASVARLLYPDAQIRTESFGDTHLPQGLFDVTVGNVPFGDYPVHDPVWNPDNKLSIHNHFILKSLGLTRPGGLVVVITSSYTMDAQNPQARRQMSALADLVTAVRLPTGGLRAGGSTDVVADVLVFKRREPGAEPGDVSWCETTEVTLPTKTGDLEAYRVNQWWESHRDNVLGTPRLTVGMYGALGLDVVPDPLGAPVPDQVHTRLVAGLMDAHRWGPVFEERSTPVGAPQNTRFVDRGVVDGEIREAGSGFVQAVTGVWQPFKVPSTQVMETRRLLELRDRTRDLLALEAVSFDDVPGLDEKRAELRALWQTYVDMFGPVTRVTRVGGDESDIVRAAPAVRRLMADPYGPLVTGLEIWEEGSEHPRPAGILLERQIVPHPPVLGVDSAADGLTVVLHETGRVDLDRIATLMGGVPVTQVISDLGDMVYETPAGGWVTAATYLSGNVREKLGEARLAAVEDPTRFTRNVTALEAVLPVDIPMGLIRPRLGAVWIPDTDVQDFMTHILGRSPQRCARLGPSRWDIDVSKYVADRPESTSEWGTTRAPFHVIVSMIVSNKPVEVRDTIRTWDDEVGKWRERTVVNPDESVAAQAKAEQIITRFQDWVWEDPDRAARLAQDYNTRFNSRVTRSYEREGAALTFPGLSASFQPHPWQREAVARILANPSTGLFHVVGAGKTAEMVIGCMELSRMGLIRKPLMVVPNNLLMQTTSEWLRLYPQARLLPADSEDTTRSARQAFLAKAAMNDWDAIIMTESAFGMIPVSAATENRYMAHEVEEIEAFLDSLRVRTDEDGNEYSTQLSIKQLEKMRDRARAQLAQNMAIRTDDGLTFEQMGVDLLVVDEIHLYKNLSVLSSIQTENKTGSLRARNLDMKLDWLRHTNGRDHPTLIGATGTPISNTLAEMWVMQHYFQPDVLAAAGVDSFDSWASTFAELVTAPELGSDAATFRLKTRLARFINLPDLVAMFHDFGDVRTQDQLDLVIPQIRVNPDTGRAEPRILLLDRTDELATYMASLTRRLDDIHSGAVKKWMDNDLNVITDGRHASLDTRLRVPTAVGGLKIEAAADRLADIWAAHKDDVYRDDDDVPSPFPGALQIVFCDLGTPKTGWNVYDGLRDALITRGLPPHSIRFIHDATTSDRKEALFADCRAGKVAVLIGSTGKMGVGTNIQRRAIHMLHMDAPWKPAEFEQRNGRILRQGNQNPVIDITVVTAKQSFDAPIWERVQRKAKFVHQIMDGSLTDRVAEDIADISDTTALYGALKAAATGNPLLVQQAELTQEVARLTTLERAHRRNLQGLQATLVRDRAALVTAHETRQQLVDAIAATTDSDTAQVGVNTPYGLYGRYHKDWYLDAAVTVPTNEIAHHLTTLLNDSSRFWPSDTVGIARYRGHTIDLRPTSGRDNKDYAFLLSLRDAPTITSVAPFNLNSGRFREVSYTGLVTRMTNMINELPSALTRTDVLIAELTHRISVGERLHMDDAFPHAAELATARAARAALDTQIATIMGTPHLPGTPPETVSPVEDTEYQWTPRDTEPPAYPGTTTPTGHTIGL